MVITRQLRIALLISILLHLFWASFISIVFLPHNFARRQYSCVNFLGSILPNSISSSRPVYKKHFIELPSEIDIQKQDFFYEMSDVSLPVGKEDFNPDSFVDVNLEEKKGPHALSFVSTKDALPEREIIFKPPFPEYPEVAMQQELRVRFVTFKICILNDGLVQEALCIHSCGNPEIDAALARYLRKWHFAPSFSLKKQIQTIKIDLDLDDQTGI
jgi:TonB family protein